MSGSEHHVIPFHTIGRTILSLRPDHDFADHHPEAAAAEVEAFQKQVSDQFAVLSSPSSDELLSLPWLRNLLDNFLLCQEDFRILLLNNKSFLAKPSMERIIDDFYDRSLKSLDLCNAIRDGIDQIRQWQKLLGIVFSSLDNDMNRRKSAQISLTEGQIQRAKKVLDDLMEVISDEKGVNSSCNRNRSFGREQSSKESRSLHKSVSWIVSRNWSASRQLQAISYNLSCPRGNDVSSTSGLVSAIYTMSCALFIVMWTMVAAIPCQDRGIQSHLSIPRQLAWAAPISSIHDRIAEESKKRKNACGLLKEISAIEKSTSEMSELLESLEVPVAGEKEVELRSKMQALKEAFEALKAGLEPLDQQVRQVFHIIVKNRIQGLDCFARSCKHKKQTDFQGLD